MNSMKLSIIIVSYNTSALTLEAATTAWNDAQSSPNLKGKTELLIVDNNSSDDSVAVLTNHFTSSRVRIIKNNRNQGFAIANNQAIAQAQGQYILLLNSDTVVQAGALDKLVAAMETHPINDATATLASKQTLTDRLGIVAATLLNEDGTLQPQGGSFPTLGSLLCHMTMIDDIPVIGRLLPSTQHTGLRQSERLQYQTQDARLIQRDWVAATAMLVRKSVFDEIGLLDEQIFMYGEDTELCMRAKHHHWDIAIHPTAKITHYGSASAGSTQAILGELKSYVYLWSKHKPLWQVPIARTIIKLGIILRLVVFGTIARNTFKMNVYRQALDQV